MGDFGMVNAARIATAGLLAYGAWRMYQQTQEDAATVDQGTDPGNDLLTTADEVLTDTSQSAAEFVDSITGGFMKVSAMAQVNPFDLNNSNVQALLRVIRTGEGTTGPNGYRTLFGGGTFDSYADHPRQTIKSSGYTSTAAGAYQFIVSSWDETKRVMGLPDFSPRSQDLAALGRIAARGALEDAKAGRFEIAIKKIAREWASMPGSPYGQPVISWDKARAIYASAGGNTAMA
jgi:muramidase (phage lysozyme)